MRKKKCEPFLQKLPLFTGHIRIWFAFLDCSHFMLYAKVRIKHKISEITPFGGIFHVMEKFDRYIGQVIDGELGLRCITFGYQYSEIAHSLMSVYFCGGAHVRIS